MTRFWRGPTWIVWAAIGGAVTAVLIVVVIVAADNGPDVDIGTKEPGKPLVTWGEPDDEPTGVIMLLHGGGWKENIEGYAQQVRAGISLQDRGYATVAVGYDEGALGFRQIEAVYAEARERFPNVPVCAYGISAGGHLAMMLATREPDLTCVIDLVGPVDLTTLADQDEEGDEGHQDAIEAFGKDKLAAYSPIRFADRIEADVLMILAEDDPVVPVEQAHQLERALPNAEVLILPKGPVPEQTAHGGGVEEGAMADALERALEFLEVETQGS